MEDWGEHGTAENWVEHHPAVEDEEHGTAENEEHGTAENWWESAKHRRQEGWRHDDWW